MASIIVSIRLYVFIIVSLLQIVYIESMSKEDECPPGRGGDHCRDQCPLGCEKCSSASMCQQCQGNYLAPDCHTCKNGFYGIGCQDVCSGCDICDSRTGECAKCKEAGIAFPSCSSVCPNGTFGWHCAEHCPSICASACDAVSGDCLQCSHGYGKGCVINCTDPDNAELCSKYCKGTCDGMCSAVTHQCDLCKPGLTGMLCNETCLKGFYGRNCKKKCPPGCKDDMCDVTDGTCKKCEPGLFGPTCVQTRGCKVGFYGDACLTPCPQTCADDVCHDNNGTCLACDPGYLGDLCDAPCSNGTYGQNCGLACAKNCSDNLCSITTGHCLQCEAGYRGDFCNETCENGTWGVDCSNSCSEYCTDLGCHPTTGFCYKCNDSRSGKFCRQEKGEVNISKSDGSDSSDSNDSSYSFLDMRAVYIFCGILVPVVIIAFPVAFYKCLVKRIYKKTKKVEYKKALDNIVATPSPEPPRSITKSLSGPPDQPKEDKIEIFASCDNVQSITNEGISVQSSITKSSISRVANSAKMTSNIAVLTKITNMKTQGSADTSRGTRSNSVAVDISLNEVESQNSIADIHSFLDDERSHSITAGHDSASKSNRSREPLIRDPMIASSSASQSLSVSESYPMTRSGKSNIKTSTDVRVTSTSLYSSHQPDNTDWEINPMDRPPTRREQLWPITESDRHVYREEYEGDPSSLPTSQKSPVPKSVTFSEANSSLMKKDSLVAVKLWKSKSSPGNSRYSKMSSTVRDNTLTTFQTDKDAERFSRINLDSSYQPKDAIYRNTSYDHEELNSLTEDISTPTSRQSSKHKVKPMIQKIFDNVLNTMKSDSNLYLNKRSEIEGEQLSSNEQLEIQMFKKTKSTNDMSSFESLNTTPGSNSPIMSPPKQSVHSMKKAPSSTHQKGKGKKTFAGHRSKSRHPRKSTKLDRNVDLRVGVSPTQSFTDLAKSDQSIHLIGEPKPSPPSKYFKLFQSPGLSNPSQISLWSESASQISDDLIVQQAPQNQLDMNPTLDNPLVLKEMIILPGANFSSDTHEIVVTGTSPRKSTPNIPDQTSEYKVTSVELGSMHKPPITFLNPMEMTGIITMVERNNLMFRSFPSMVRPPTMESSVSKEIERSDATTSTNLGSPKMTTSQTSSSNTFHKPRISNVIRCPTTREISPMSKYTMSQNTVEPVTTAGHSNKPPNYQPIPHPRHVSPVSTDQSSGPSTNSASGVVKRQQQRQIINKSSDKLSDIQEVPSTLPSAINIDRKSDLIIDLAKSKEPGHPLSNVFTYVKFDTPRPSNSDITPGSDTDSQTAMASWTDKTIQPDDNN